MDGYKEFLYIDTFQDLSRVADVNINTEEGNILFPIIKYQNNKLFTTLVFPASFFTQKYNTMIIIYNSPLTLELILCKAMCNAPLQEYDENNIITREIIPLSALSYQTDIFVLIRTDVHPREMVKLITEHNRPTRRHLSSVSCSWWIGSLLTCAAVLLVILYKYVYTFLDWE